MVEEIPFHHISSQSLLRPKTVKVFKPEEDCRPWRARSSQVFDKPFLRIWDQYSGSQPCDGCLTSRAPYKRLDTYLSRKDTLTIHSNHRDWRPTPYISFTTSSTAVQKLADMRNKTRGSQTLTVVDPEVRIKKGLPILAIATEMSHYEIEDPYQKGYQYFKDHYVCLWQVSRDEIVDTWQWDDLVAHQDWYEDIVIPAFIRHREEQMRNHSTKNRFDLSSLASALPDTSTPRISTTLSGCSDISSEVVKSNSEGEANPSDADR